MTPEAIARKCADLMWTSDAASQDMGMRIDAIAPGSATMSMVVEKHHTNGHNICHGGYIFSLADSAFAFACNSRNRLAVAQHNTITYLRPGQIGDRMVARACEITLKGRTGIYDVLVIVEGEAIASFRGVSRIVEGEHFAESLIDANEDSSAGGGA